MPSIPPPRSAVQGGALRASDRDGFARFGIDGSLLDASGVCRVTHQQAEGTIGIRHHGANLEGIAFPYFDPRNGELRSWRVRRDHPEVENGRPVAKYVSPPERHRLYFVPGYGALLPDTSVAVVLVEAEKSALALTAAATRTGRVLLPIAL